MTIFLLAAFLLVIQQSGEVTSDDDGLLERIRHLDAGIDPGNRLSGVLLVARGDDIVLHEGFGWADHELQVPNTPETRFCIASITKELTRLVAWQLLIEGEIGMDTPLSRFVPDFPRAAEITVEHLIRHRAGIRHRVTTDADTCKPLDPAAITELAAERALIADPGSFHAYSSATYSVLARVIELVEHAPFARVLQQRVFDPAGMSSSCDVDGRTLLPGRAKSYVPGREGLLNAPLRDLSFLAGAGSVISTSTDLLAFHRAFRGDTFHSTAWASLQGKGPTHWTGASNGFHAFLDHDPATDTTVVFVGNTFGSGPGQLRVAMPRLLAGEPVAGRPRPTELATVRRELLEQYVGEYRSRPGASWTVELRGDDLMIADAVVLPLSDHEFWFQGWSRPMSFERAVREDHEDHEDHEEPGEAAWLLVSGEERWARVEDP